MRSNFVIRALILILITLGIFTWAFFKVEYVSTLQFEGEVININRGKSNIPQVTAPSFKSALYAWGYTLAQDRLFQIAFKRLLVQGRLAEHLGQKAIEVDKLFREINLGGWAVRSAERFKKENFTQYLNFQAYVQGINDHFKKLTFKPLEFYLIGLEWEEWTVADILGSFKLLKWSLSFGIADQYIRSSLLKKFTKEEVDKIITYRPEDWLKGQFFTQETIVKGHEIPKHLLEKSEGFNPENYKPISVQEMLEVGFFEYLDINEEASNSWVIGGQHTDTGHPIICNDPHLDSSLPGEWHQIKVYYPNQHGKEVYNIVASPAGLPMFVGKSTYISSALTTNNVDSQDLFRQTIEGQKYLLDGQWRNLKVRVETIKVKGANPVEYKVYETHRGPLISHIGYKGYLYKVSEPISLCWNGFTDADFIFIAASSHIAEFDDYSQLYPFLAKYTDYGPSLNFLYATADGHIGYYALGLVPLRKHPHSGMYVKDGTSSENDWIGFVQGEDKLHLEDPERGYISTANNMAAPHAYFNGILDITIYTGRADRIQKLIKDQIASGRKISKNFMKKIQADTVDVLCLETVAGMKKKIASGPHNYSKIFSVFENFDCNFHSESTTASIYLTFFQNVYEQIHIEGFNWTFNLLNLLAYHNNIYKFILQDHSEEDFKKLESAMSDSVKQLRQFFHSEDTSRYRYGQLHKDLMIHRPFSNSPLKSLFEHETTGFGNTNTPNVGSMYKIHLKDYRTNHRANLRLIMSYYDDSEWVVDGGTSQKFYSQYYKDQTELFFAGKYLLMDAWNRTQSVQ